MSVDLAGWTPIRLVNAGNEPVVEWCDLSDASFTAPFFGGTVGGALQQPFHLLFRPHTPLDVLAAQQARSPGPEPNGFIFHLSRCGSTLIAQMLAALPRTRVISEAEPIDSLLRLRLDADRQSALLRALLGALGGSRAAISNYVVKFDPWNVLDIPAVRAAFPRVPAVFVFRDPVEIIASHRRTISGRLVGNQWELELAGLSLADRSATLEEYCARVLAVWMRAALAAPDLRLVAYGELPAVVPLLDRSFWHLDLDAGDEAIMLAAAAFNAKSPRVPFTPDSAAKRAELPEAVTEMIERVTGPAYRQLLDRHAQQPPPG